MDSYKIDLGVIAKIDENILAAEEAREIDLAAPAPGEVSAADLNNVTPATVVVVVDRLATLVARCAATAQSCGPGPSLERAQLRRWPVARTGIL